LCEMFRHPWPVIVSWQRQPWRSHDRGLSLVQRSNGSGGFSGSGLNITTRVRPKNIMDDDDDDDDDDNKPVWPMWLWVTSQGVGCKPNYHRCGHPS
jgi:hypothetical protein